MSIRGIGDAYAFQRLLWLLIGTVVAPTAVLAGYGVYAIRSTRAALYQRSLDLREAQLDGMLVEQRSAHLLLQRVDTGIVPAQRRLIGHVEQRRRVEVERRARRPARGCQSVRERARRLVAAPAGVRARDRQPRVGKQARAERDLGLAHGVVGRHQRLGKPGGQTPGEVFRRKSRRRRAHS